MSVNIDIPTAAGRLGVSERYVRRMCTDGKLPGAKRDGREWLIPTAAHPKLADREVAADGGLLHETAKHKQEQAVWRLGIIRQAEAFAAAAVRDGANRSQALAAFARQADVSVRSLQRWMQQYKQAGMAGLIDKRGATGGLEIVSEEAWQEFLSLYLDPRQPSVKQCYDLVSYINRTQDRGWRLPSLRRMQQMAAEKIPMASAVLFRQGLAAYDARCAPYVQTDMDSIEPGAVWVGDHHQFDCWVRFGGKWIRPWITAWEDMRSRAMVGWQITPAPNSTTILQAFRRGCQSYGPPDAVKIDNGKDYDSELWTGTTKQRRRLNVALDETNIAGLYAMMDIGVSFAIPYHPQAKSVERWFDTIESQYIRTLPTYCGKDTLRRPEGLADYLASRRAIDEAMELDEFAGRIAEYIHIYNRTPHTGRSMDGAAPLEVLHRRRARRMVSDETLTLLCQVWTGELKVGKNGVQVKGLWYGQYDPTLLMLQGRSVRCAYDEDNMSKVRVYDAHTYRYITTAEQATMVAYGAAASESDLREAMASKARARKQVKAYKPAARIAATELGHLTLQAAAARAKTVADEGSKPARPVATPLDGQAAAVRRTERMRAVKRAAGAEGVRQVLDFDFDDDEPVRPATRLDWDTEPEYAEQPRLRLDWNE